MSFSICDLIYSFDLHHKKTIVKGTKFIYFSRSVNNKISEYHQPTWNLYRKGHLRFILIKYHSLLILKIDTHTNQMKPYEKVIKNQLTIKFVPVSPFIREKDASFFR